jgi:hypothetical protein
MKLTESMLRTIIKEELKKVLKETYHQNPPFGGMEQPHDYSKQISDTSSPRNKEFLEFVRRTVYGAKSRNKPSIKVDDLANSHEAFQIIGNGSTHSRAIARGLIKNNYTVKTDADGKEYIQVIDYSKP